MAAAAETRRGLAGAARRAMAGLTGFVRLRTVADRPDLKITFAPGESKEAVVVFNSIFAKAAGEGEAEFLGTASGGGARPVFFVTDPMRAWFQGADVADRITDTLGDAFVAERVAPKLTLGVSMGGYGAIVFAPRIGARIALGLGAQWDVGPNAQETAWREERARIDKFRLGPAGDHIDGSVKVRVVHGARDRWHSQQYAGHPGVRAWLKPKRGHNIARFLKEDGLLTPLVEAAYRGRGVSKVMQQFGAKRRRNPLTDPDATLASPHPAHPRASETGD